MPHHSKLYEQLPSLEALCSPSFGFGREIRFNNLSVLHICPVTKQHDWDLINIAILIQGDTVLEMQSVYDLTKAFFNKECSREDIVAIIRKKISEVIPTEEISDIEIRTSSLRVSYSIDVVCTE